MKRFVFLLAAGLLSATAAGQMPVTTKQECNRRCVSMTDPYPARTRHEEKLKQIRDKKKVETDAVKLKQLATDEEGEIDRFNDEHEKMCRSICQHNPEE
jgi:hypothetical protein